MGFFLRLSCLPLLLAAMAPASTPAAATVPATARQAAAMVRTAEAAVAEASKPAEGFAIVVPGSPASLEAQWRSVRLWLGLWLAEHPHAAPAAAVQAAKGDISADLAFQPLGDGAILAAVTTDAFGTAFILRPARNGRYVTALALDEPGTWGIGGPAALKAWRSDRAGYNCPDQGRAMMWEQCGPIAPSLQPLDTGPAQGRDFALIGRHVKSAGATDGYQLSIWHWTGRRAQPLFVHSFAQMADEPIVVATGRDTLTIQVKDNWRRLFSCGGCSGRQIEQSFAISGSGARLTRSRSLAPDMDLVDMLYDRLFRAQPAGDLATPAVLAALAPVVQAQVLQAKQWKLDSADVGLVMGWKAAERRGTTRLCLDTDNVGSQIFTIDHRGSRPRVIAMEAGGGHACEGPGEQN